LPALQATQAAPPAPHAALAVPGWHCCSVSQQPVGHVDELHAQAPLMHSLPAEHATHATPPVPHWEFRVPNSHVGPLQQPAGHVLALQASSSSSGEASSSLGDVSLSSSGDESSSSLSLSLSSSSPAGDEPDELLVPQPETSRLAARQIAASANSRRSFFMTAPPALANPSARTIH
jgi:hypothetical protein